MNLVLIYGPYASGKLTIATELQKLTNYKFLEKNAVNKPVLQVFPFGTPVFYRITKKIRLNIIREAASHDVDLISTLVYAQGKDDEYIRDMIKSVTKEGGNVKFIRVTCPSDVLLKRVAERSREGKDKVMDPDLVEQLLSKSDLASKIPFVDTFDVDSSKHPAIECAELIKKYLDSGS